MEKFYVSEHVSQLMFGACDSLRTGMICIVSGSVSSSPEYPNPGKDLLTKPCSYFCVVFKHQQHKVPGSCWSHQ